MSESQTKIKYLVADTTAFINAVPLQEYAENIYTVPDVMKEVRNKRQIRRLCVLPYDLQVREPTAESVQHCLEFSKKTGDYASLSGIDMKIIALTYELETELVGTDHLRSEPLLSKLVASKKQPAEFGDSDRLPGWCNPPCSSTEGDTMEQNENENENSVSDSDTDTEDEFQSTFGSDVEEEEISAAGDSDLARNSLDQSKLEHRKLEKMLQNLDLLSDEHKNSDEETILMPILAAKEQSLNSAEGSKEQEQPGVEEINDDYDNDEDDEDEDDDSSWITPSNVKDMKRAFLGGESEDMTVPLVACMSTDFAIQNTLRQMNLKVAALNGLVIRHTRTFILRCYACYKTTSIMSKLFCPNCGHKTLKKVAVSVDEQGKQMIHINTRRPLTSKYKNQSIPRFRGGKHSHNPILFEDQPMPRQMPSRVAKTKTNALDEDYTAGFSPFAARDTDSKSAVLRSKGQLGKQWARNTNYEEERRRRHYNRLYK